MSSGKSQGEFPGRFTGRREIKKDAELRQELNSIKGKAKNPLPGLEGAEGTPCRARLTRTASAKQKLQDGPSDISVYTNIKEGEK